MSGFQNANVVLITLLVTCSVNDSIVTSQSMLKSVVLEMKKKKKSKKKEFIFAK